MHKKYFPKCMVEGAYDLNEHRLVNPGLSIEEAKADYAMLRQKLL